MLGLDLSFLNWELISKFVHHHHGFDFVRGHHEGQVAVAPAQKLGFQAFP